MKHVIKNSMIVLMSVLFVMESCSKSNTSISQPSTDNPSITVQSGSWMINNLSQSTEDKTSQFAGYVFTFASGGVMKAQINGAVTTGAWSYTPSAVTYYGSTPSKASFTINLGNSTPLSRLSKIWNVDSTNTNSTNLSLISPEVAENLKLNFTKIK